MNCEHENVCEMGKKLQISGPCHEVSNEKFQDIYIGYCCDCNKVLGREYIPESWRLLKEFL